MKILKFHAENIKKLKVVEITPSGDLVQITGKNSSGKTSVLDSIWWALGGKEHIQGKPVRDGQEKGKIILDLGEYIVERRFTAEGGTQLFVESRDGARFKSPQEILDRIIGDLSFDPLEFSRMKPKEQFDQLRTIAKVDFNFEEALGQDRKDHEERRGVNREVGEIEVQLKNIVLPPEVPDKPLDPAELMIQLDAVIKHNQEIDRDIRGKDVLNESIKDLTKDIAELEKVLDERKKEKADKEFKFTAISVSVEHKKDEKEIRDKISSVQIVNKLYEHAQQKKQLATKLEQKKGESEAYTKKLDDRQKARQTAIQTAKLPVAGISFGDDLVLLNGIPLDQAASAEQLKVSVAIAMASNPKLKVLRIKDANLLDEDGMKTIESMIKEGGFQVWMERVDSTGKIGLYLEDGEVKFDNESQQKLAV